MRTNSANLINKAFKALRKRPCMENKCRLCMVVLAQAETDIERNIAMSIVSKISEPDSTVATIHYSLIGGAQQLDIDPATLSGGVTPED